LGAVIAAPLPETRELFCRNGLKYYARIRASNIRNTLAAINRQLAILKKSASGAQLSRSAKNLAHELELAARMAEQSCRFMLWQKSLAEGKTSPARRLAQSGIRELTRLEKDFKAYWPSRNKGKTAKCSPFLRWRINDYRKTILPFKDKTT
jgi:hypothetical protein